MISMADIVADEELGGTPFVILRTFYRKSEGEKEFLRQDRYETIGTIHPAKLEDIQLLPEEYHHETVMMIHSPQSLSLGGPVNDLDFTSPDRILYQYRTYLVISVRDWSSFGFCKALAVLQRDSNDGIVGGSDSDGVDGNNDNDGDDSDDRVGEDAL